MRKVKLLALLLAVLMVVTAFAGCANTDVIESDVANLDERVTALENLLNGIDKEIDDVTAKIESVDQQIADLKGAVEADKTADEIAALEKQLADQKAALEAQKAAAEAAQKAAEEAKKAAEKAAADQKAANDALLQQIQNILNQQQADKDAAAKVLADAKTAALARIATIESGLAGKHADLVAAAKAAVNAATTENACDKAVADLEVAIVAADAAAGAAALAAAQKAASEEIAVIRVQKDAHKDHFFKDEYELIVKALAAADTNVAAAKTEAEVNAAVETLEAELTKYAAIDVKLYEYFVKLWANMTEANRAVNTEAQAYIEKAEQHYINHSNAALKTTAGTDALNVKALTEYVYGKGGDGKDLVVDLPYMLEKIDDVYTGLAYEDVLFEAKVVSGTHVYYSALLANVPTYSLAKAAAEAKKLDTRVTEFTSSSSYKETWTFLRNTGTNADTFGRLHADYEAWVAKVKPLSEENLALVTTTAKLERIKGIVDNYMAAEKAIVDLGIIDYTNQSIKNVFVANGWGAGTGYDGTNNPFYNTTTQKLVKDSVFAPIDAKIDPWAEAYKLSAADKADIINYSFFWDTTNNKADTTWNYANYLVDRDYVAMVTPKFDTFKSTVIPAIQKLNGMTAIEVATYDAYDAAVKTFNDWIQISKQSSVKLNKSSSSTVTGTLYNYVNAANIDLMIKLTGIKDGYTTGVISDLAKSHATKISGTNYGSYVSSSAAYKNLGLASTQLYYSKFTHTDFNPGYGSLSVTKLASDDKILDLVTFNAQVETEGVLRPFLRTTYKAYNDAAKAIKVQIQFLSNELSYTKKLYNNLPILALEGKTVYLDVKKDDASATATDLKNTDNVYINSDHNALIATKDSNTLYFTAGTDYKYLTDIYASTLQTDLLFPNTNGADVFRIGASTSDTKRPALQFNDGTNATAVLTIKALEDASIKNDYKGLAERVLTNNSVYSMMETLKADFTARIAELKTNGADAFTAAVKAAGYVRLQTDAVDGFRTLSSTIAAKTTYDASKGPRPSDNCTEYIYYVNLNDEAKFQAAYDILWTWISKYAGNSAYEANVAKKFEFTVDGTKYAYTDGMILQSIFGAEIDDKSHYNSYEVFMNMAAQIDMLRDKRDALAENILLLDLAMKTEKTGYNDFSMKVTGDNLNKAVLLSYVETKDKDGNITNYAWSDLSVDGTTGYVKFNETKTATAFTAPTTTINALIEALSKEYADFETLNAEISDKYKVTASGYLASYTADDVKVADVIDALKLAYVKAYYLNDSTLQTAASAQTHAGTAMKTFYLPGIATCTVVPGSAEGCVEHWVDQMVAAGYTVPAAPSIFGGVATTDVFGN